MEQRDIGRVRAVRRCVSGSMHSPSGPLPAGYWLSGSSRLPMSRGSATQYAPWWRIPTVSCGPAWRPMCGCSTEPASTSHAVVAGTDTVGAIGLVEDLVVSRRASAVCWAPAIALVGRRFRNSPATDRRVGARQLRREPLIRSRRPIPPPWRSPWPCRRSSTSSTTPRSSLVRPAWSRPCWSTWAARVSAGQALARLESTDQAIALDQAQEKSFDNTRQLVERQRALATAGVVTKADSERVEFEHREATLALRKAQREFDLTRIVAPFSGVVTGQTARVDDW